MSDERIASALLPPLWGIVVSYADRVEQMMLAKLAALTAHIKTWGDPRDGIFSEKLGESGHVAVAEWCAYTLQSIDWAVVGKDAIFNGCIDLVRWIIARTGQIPVLPGFYSNAITLAADSGQIAMITLLRENGCDWGEGTARVAAGHSLETLQMIPRDLWGNNLYVAAAMSNDVRTVEYLKKEGYAWSDEDLISVFMFADSSKMLDALVKHLPAPLDDTRVCVEFAERDNVELLDAARRHGFAWNYATTYAAATAGSWKSLMWLINNGCPWNATTKDSARTAVDTLTPAAVVAWLAAPV